MAKPVTPLLTVDCVVIDKLGRVLLIRRGHDPFKGMYALPGGFVDVGETVEQACSRELVEEVGIWIDPNDLRLVGVFSDPNRDPRGHSCSVAFVAQAPAFATAKAGDDAAAVEWVEDWTKMELAFDHALIVEQALQVGQHSQIAWH